MIQNSISSTFLFLDADGKKLLETHGGTIAKECGASSHFNELQFILIQHISTAMVPIEEFDCEQGEDIEYVELEDG